MKYKVQMLQDFEHKTGENSGISLKRGSRYNAYRSHLTERGWNLSHIASQEVHVPPSHYKIIHVRRQVVKVEVVLNSDWSVKHVEFV